MEVGEKVDGPAAPQMFHPGRWSPEWLQTTEPIHQQQRDQPENDPVEEPWWSDLLTRKQHT